MKKIFAATVLAVLIAMPALAQSTSSTRGNAPKNKKTSKPAVSAQPSSVYSTNPEYDVYFRGEYVGSDPDPRIRATLRNEARRSYGFRD